MARAEPSQIATLDQIREAGREHPIGRDVDDRAGGHDSGRTVQAHLSSTVCCPTRTGNGAEWPSQSRLSAVRLGLQSSLRKLGYVPKSVQTDNSSAATRRLGISEEEGEGKSRGYTIGYLQLLDHYGLAPASTHVGNPNENGDVESQNGALKRAVKQHLLLRGSREFDDIDEYEAFLFAVMEKRNRRRQVLLAEEIAVMKPVTATALGHQHSEESACQSRQPDSGAAPDLLGTDLADWQRGDRPHPGMDVSTSTMPGNGSNGCPGSSVTKATTSTTGT